MTTLTPFSILISEPTAGARRRARRTARSLKRGERRIIRALARLQRIVARYAA